MSLDRLLSGDTVTVTTVSGGGAYGPSYAAAREVACRVQFARQLVRDAGGSEVVSEVTIYAHPTVGSDRTVDVFAPGSLVTVDGRECQVITAAAFRGQGPPVLVEITCT